MSYAVLDIPTLFFANALVGYALACVVWASRAGLRDLPMHGMGLWAVGDLCCALGRTAFLMRADWHPMLAIVLPNTLFIGGHVAHYLALRQHASAALPRRLAWALPAAVAGSFALATALQASFEQRTVLATAWCALLFVAAVPLFRRTVGRAIGARVIAVAYSVMLAMMVIRLLGILARPGAQDIAQAAVGMLPAVLVVTIMLDVAATVGFLLCLQEGMRGRLEQQSRTDMLTGALNRRGLIEELKREAGRAHRTGHPVSLVMFDIDHFKQVNDELGHPAGDRALQGFADLVRGTMRTSDVLARYGGEEFVLLLPHAGLADATGVAQRVGRRLQAEPLDGDLPTLTVSAGVASSVEQPDGLDTMALIATADRRLYQAKQHRNRVVARD